MAKSAPGHPALVGGMYVARGVPGYPALVKGM